MPPKLLYIRKDDVETVKKAEEILHLKHLCLSQALVMACKHVIKYKTLYPVKIYKIVAKNNHKLHFASGFIDKKDAEKWLKTYDPALWYSLNEHAKSVDDLEIVEEL